MNYLDIIFAKHHELKYSEKCPKCDTNKTSYIRRHIIHIGWHCKKHGFIKFLSQQNISQLLQKIQSSTNRRHKIYCTKKLYSLSDIKLKISNFHDTLEKEYRND